MLLRGSFMTSPGAWLALFLLFLPAYTQAADRAAELYYQGLRHYQAERFDAARAALERAVELAPAESGYHHWLGRTYGRLAERADLFRALSLSRRTLEQLSRAVSLDDRNVAAIKDLIEYYRRAPGFLGGNRRKAEELARRVRSLESGGLTRQEALADAQDTPS